MAEEIDWAYWERRAPWLKTAREIGAAHVREEVTEAGNLSLLLKNYAERRRWIRIEKEAHMTVNKGEAQHFVDSYVPNARIQDRNNRHNEVFFVDLADLNRMLGKPDTLARFLRESLESRMKALR